METRNITKTELKKWFQGLTRNRNSLPVFSSEIKIVSVTHGCAFEQCNLIGYRQMLHSSSKGKVFYFLLGQELFYVRPQFLGRKLHIVNVQHNEINLDVNFVLF
jgi:hypothetical protein